MDRKLIEKVVQEARDERASLVICDRRDTFAVEAEDVGEIEITEEYLRIRMRDGKAIVYVDLASIYKLVVEKERAPRAGIRAGFAAAQG